MNLQIPYVLVSLIIDMVLIRDTSKGALQFHEIIVEQATGTGFDGALFFIIVDVTGVAFLIGGIGFVVTSPLLLLRRGRR